MEEQVIQPGSYVRRVAEDMGTGKVMVVRHDTFLRDDGTIEEVTAYAVRWLDNGFQTWEAPTTVSPSARAVPKFETPEEAEEWLEKATKPGQWVQGVQDASDAVGDQVEGVIMTAVDEALQRILDEDNGS